jgi:hypothetical protein
MEEIAQNILKRFFINKHLINEKWYIHFGFTVQFVTNLCF